MEYLSLPIIFAEFITYINDVDTLCNFELAFSNYPSMKILHKLILRHLISINATNSNNIFDICKEETVLMHKIGDQMISKHYCKRFTMCDWSEAARIARMAHISRTKAITPHKSFYKSLYMSPYPLDGNNRSFIRGECPNYDPFNSNNNNNNNNNNMSDEFERKWLSYPMDISEFLYVTEIQKHLVKSDNVCNDLIGKDIISQCVEQQMLQRIDKMINKITPSSSVLSTMSKKTSIIPKIIGNNNKNKNNNNVDLLSPSPSLGGNNKIGNDKKRLEKIFNSTMLCNNKSEKYLSDNHKHKLNKRRRILMRVRIQSSMHHRFSFEYFSGLSNEFIDFINSSFGNDSKYFLNALMHKILLYEMKNDCKKVEFFTLLAKYNSASSEMLWPSMPPIGSVVSIAMVVNGDLSRVCLLNYDGRWHLSNNI